jgi:hypothetical protein
MLKNGTDSLFRRAGITPLQHFRDGETGVNPFFSKLLVHCGHFALASVLVLGGCGYVGPIVPPSPEIPNAISNLNVIERGDRLEITFTAPVTTTDSRQIRKFSEIELRIGPEPRPFGLEQWAAAAKVYEIPVPAPRDEDDTKPVAMSYQLSSTDWIGQHVAVAVRSAVKSGKNYSSWSNVMHMAVAPPLHPPELSVEATAQGYKLGWNNEGANANYRVFRQSPADKAPVQIGTSDQPEYLDRTSQWDTRYTYSVIAASGPVESLASNRVEVNHADTFPPSVPSGVAALAAADSVELSWQRSPESDLKGYYVYRSANGGGLERQGDLVALPAYSDHSVEHGKTYRYEVSAIDQEGNESAKSAPVEVVFP